MQQAAQSTMSVSEADIAVKSLKPFPIDQIGTAAWKAQRESMELLNFCSHTNASLHKDDFVMTFLVEQEKILVLLHELLVMETWRRKVLPKCKQDIVATPTATYLYVNYENILLNFLECVLYHDEAVVAMGDDIAELLDYSWRQVNGYVAQGTRCGTLNQIVPTETDLMKAGKKDEAAKLRLDQTGYFDQQLEQLETVRSLSSISILWFIVDKLDALPMAIMNAILLKIDLMVGISDVLLAQPYMRRGTSFVDGKTTVVQKFMNGAFCDISDSQQRVCVPEAHCWFIMHKLLCDRECRKKYFYTTYKKEAILRIKRFINETLLDQIPALVDVQRALEEMTFLEPPSGTEEKFKSSLIIEQMPRIMASIDNPNRNWDALVDTTKKMLADPRGRMEDAQRVSRLFDQLTGMDSM